MCFEGTFYNPTILDIFSALFDAFHCFSQKHCHTFSLKLMAEQSSDNITGCYAVEWNGQQRMHHTLAVLLSFILSVSSFNEFFIKFWLHCNEE